MNSLRIDPEPKCIFTWVVHVLRGLYYYLTLGLPSRLLSYFLQAFLVHPLASLLFLVQIVHLDPILIGGIDIDLIVARIAEAGNTEVDNHCLLRRHTLKNRFIFKIICRKRLPKNFQKKSSMYPIILQIFIRLEALESLSFSSSVLQSVLTVAFIGILAV